MNTCIVRIRIPKHQSEPAPTTSQPKVMPQVRVIRLGGHFLITDDEDLEEDTPPPPVLRELIVVDDDFDPECYTFLYQPVQVKVK